MSVIGRGGIRIVITSLCGILLSLAWSVVAGTSSWLGTFNVVRDSVNGSDDLVLDVGLNILPRRHVVPIQGVVYLENRKAEVLR
jgi:hypothetical protein